MDQPSSNPRESNRQLITRRLPIALLLTGGLLASGSCGLIRAPAQRLTAPMPVQAPLRKQVLQGYMPFGSIGWVDNNKVVFHGIPIGSKEKQALYLWDIHEEPQKLLERSYNSCVNNGTIQALQLNGENENKTFQIRGPEFTPKQKPHPLSAATPGIHDPISCEWIATPKSLQQRKWLPLRRGKGFLDFGPLKDGAGIQRVSHLRPDLQTKQDTGIRIKQPLLPKAVYSAHNDSYLVFSLNVGEAELQQWRISDQRRIWKLDSHARGTPLNIPYGEWSNQDISFLQARPGLLILSKNFGRKGAPGGAGLYLLPPGQGAQRLERGLVKDAAASPDGCRIAYGFRPRLDTGIPEGGPRLVVLDLCGTSTAAKR